jgi:hypothetical protein
MTQNINFLSAMLLGAQINILFSISSVDAFIDSEPPSFHSAKQ